MVKIGITGVNGFIGWHLSSYLSINNEKFKVVDFKGVFLMIISNLTSLLKIVILFSLGWD